MIREETIKLKPLVLMHVKSINIYCLKDVINEVCL